MGKTPEYTKKAIANYQKKFDRCAVNLPKGTADKIRALSGESVNSFINRLIDAELTRLENGRPAAAVPASGNAEKETPGAAVDASGIEFEMPFG